MRSLFRVTVPGAVFGLMMMFASPAFGQMWMVGSPTSNDAQDAAHFAVTSRSETSGMEFDLKSIVNFERQDSNGQNFRLCLEVSADGDEAFKVQVVVHRNKERQMSLKSWQDSNCQKVTPPKSGGFASLTYAEPIDTMFGVNAGS